MTRKTVFTIMLMLMLAITANAGNAPIITKNIFSAETLEAAGTATSTATDLSNMEGYFTIQVAVSGSGTIKIEYLLSNDGTNYLEPTSASDIATGVTATSGPGGNGKNIYSFSPEMAKYVKIKITETGATDTVTVTAWLAIQ